MEPTVIPKMTGGSANAKKSIVVVGGGTGTFAALSGLKQYAEQIAISAVVTMADTGGSTGRLRDEFGYLPVGDVRMALVALADEALDDDQRLRELFLYRFSKGGADLAGHNFGNLLLVALTDMLGSEIAAIRFAERLLRTKGRVHPVTTDHVELVATYDDGVTLRGEGHIDEPTADRFSHHIVGLAAEPEGHILPDAERAILEADVIVLGPGDLFTSVLAVCVVGGVGDALRTSKAKIVHVANLMTKRGQTTGMSIEDHATHIERVLERPLDAILAHNGVLPEPLLARYRDAGEYPSTSDGTREITACDIVSPQMVEVTAGDALRRSLIRHDRDKLAHILMTYL